MNTEFGKSLRKLRIDKGEILKNMADKLGMTSSYLSAIECGKRNIPDDLIEKLTSIYCLDEKEQQELLAGVDRAGVRPGGAAVPARGREARGGQAGRARGRRAGP